MTFTKPRNLVLTAVIVGLLAHLGFRVGYGDLPPIPRFTGITFAVLALGELIFGFNLRARINHRPETRPVPPLVAARAVALAKASSIVGAVMVGVWGALLVYRVPDQGVVAAASEDIVTSIIGLVSAGALVGAALWLEYCCKTPNRPDEPDRSNDTG